MKVRILGGHGGQAKGFATTSYLIDESLLMDAGAVASALTINEQTLINDILISHSHLDHIKDLAFICDNCFGLRQKPFMVHTHATVKEHITTHLLNDIIWPDFTKLPNAQNPTMMIEAIEPDKMFTAGDYQVTPIKVNHPHDAMGYIIERQGSAVLFTLDTGPTEQIWLKAHQIKNLKAIFTEVSFPNSMQKIADLSNHHTTQSMKVEIQKMPADLPIILTHLKPNYREVILKEIKALNDPRIIVLEKDGLTFEF